MNRPPNEAADDRHIYIDLESIRNGLKHLIDRYEDKSFDAEYYGLRLFSFEEDLKSLYSGVNLTIKRGYNIGRIC